MDARLTVDGDDEKARDVRGFQVFDGYFGEGNLQNERDGICVVENLGFKVRDAGLRASVNPEGERASVHNVGITA